MKHNWTIYEGKRFIASGSIEAKDDREALRSVLFEEAEGRVDDKSYTITVGNLSMSSYGDEFKRSGRAAGSLDMEEEILQDGYIFSSETPLANVQEAVRKVLSHTGLKVCRHPNMNGDAVNPETNEIHAQCMDCGFINPSGTGVYRGSPSWKDAVSSDLARRIEKHASLRSQDPAHIERVRQVPVGYVVELKGGYKFCVSIQELVSI